MPFTDVFSAGTIQPTDVSYAAYTSTASLTLVWPIEASPGNNVVAIKNDVDMSATTFTVTLPDARQTSVGTAPLFNNVGSNAFNILGATGATIQTASTGGVYILYLTAVTTESGTWRTFQMGAGTASASAAALAGYGIEAIGATLNQEYQASSTAVTPTTLGLADRAALRVWTGGAGTFALTAAATLTNGWFCNVYNAGTGALTIDPSGGETINNVATWNLNPGDSAIVCCDSTEFFTLGFGQGVEFAFDFTTIDVSGTGNYTLSGTELNRIAYRFTGTLTGARDIIVPSTVQQYWMDNSATGSFVFGVRTTTQASPGVSVSANARDIMYCDGTNVLDADTAGLTAPLAITAGGTGATTAAAARYNLDAAGNLDAIAYAVFLS